MASGGGGSSGGSVGGNSSFVFLFFFLSLCFSLLSSSSGLLLLFSFFQSFPPLLFFCSVSSSLLLLFFLGPPVFIGKNRGGTWLGWPLCCRPKHCPRNTSPPSSLTRGKLQASGGGVGVFLKREMAVIEEKKNLLLLPLLCASRGRRRPTVPSKRHCFGFFLMNSV